MSVSNICEYMKLRQYFINMVAHSSPDIPLPSERELAKSFGVARETVRRALLDMVTDHYLIKRARRGYFVNQQMLTPCERRNKIIGLIYHDGKNALYNNESALAVGAFLTEVIKYDFSLQFVTSSYSDIINGCLDGLIWFWPRGENYSVFKRLEEENKIPVIGYFDRDEPDCRNYIFMSPQRESYQKTQYLIDCGCRRILRSTEPDLQMEDDGYRSALADAGIPYDPELLIPGQEFMSRLPEILKKKHVDGIVTRYMLAEDIYAYAHQNAIRIPEDLKLITGFFHYTWSPAMTIKPFKTIANLLLKQMNHILNGKKTELRKKDLSWNIIPGSSAGTFDKKTKLVKGD